MPTSLTSLRGFVAFTLLAVAPACAVDVPEVGAEEMTETAASELAAAKLPYGFFGLARTATVAAGAFQRLAIVKDFDTGTCRFEAHRCQRDSACVAGQTSSFAGSCTVAGSEVRLMLEGVGVSSEPLVLTLKPAAGGVQLVEGGRMVGTLPRERNPLTAAVMAELAKPGEEKDFDALSTTPRGFYAREYISSAEAGSRGLPRFTNAASRALVTKMESVLEQQMDTEVDVDADDIARSTVGAARRHVTVLSDANGKAIAAELWWIQDGCDRVKRSKKSHYDSEAEAKGQGCKMDDVQWQLYAYFGIQGDKVQYLGGSPYEWSGY